MHRAILAFCAGASAYSFASGAAVTEDFTLDPQTRGWKTHGDSGLFAWQKNSGELGVTWDSARSNSFYYLPLGTILSRDDNFSFEFKVRLADVAIGTTPDKPYTFQIAAGFLNLHSATATNFNRASGQNNLNGPENLVEFDYFPDSGFGATVALSVVSTNNRFAFSHNHPLELTPGDWFHVILSYQATNQSLETTMTKNGQPFGLPPENQFPALSLAGLPDFRVDSFAISSYSDAGQNFPDLFSPMAWLMTWRSPSRRYREVTSGC